MNNRDKTIVPKDTTSAPRKKRAKSPGDDQNSKGKKTKIRCKRKPIFPKKAVSIANVKRAESLEDDHHNYYKAQHSKTKTEELSIFRLNKTSKRFEEEMEEENETDILTAEHSPYNNISSQFSINQSNNTSIECSSEDVQWEIMHVPDAITSQFPNNVKSQNTLNKMKNETESNALVVDSITNDACADPREQQENGCISTKNLEHSISYNEFHFTSPNRFKEHKVDDNELAAKAIASDATFDSKYQQDNTYFITENLGMGLIQTLKFHFTSPETVANDFSITESIITSQNNNTSDLFHGQQEKIEIGLQQLPNSFYTNLDENAYLEEMNNDMNASKFFLEEIENERFHAGTSTMEENVAERCAGEFTLQKSDTNLLLQENATTLDYISVTESNITQSSRNNEERVKRITSCNSSFQDLNLKQCGHSNTNSDLQILKNRSKLNKMPKYYVMNSNSLIKNRTIEQRQRTNLQEIIKNTLKDKHPELCLQDDIGMRLEIFLWDMLYRIGNEAENLVLLSRKQLFDKRCLKYAIKLSLEKMKNEADVVYGKINQKRS